jgi:hypothetical protein
MKRHKKADKGMNLRKETLHPLKVLFIFITIPLIQISFSCLEETCDGNLKVNPGILGIVIRQIDLSQGIPPVYFKFGP